jgi:hypothetical protein
MKASGQTIQEFAELHQRYLTAHERMSVLQAAALEGMRKIGIGCVTAESRQEFIKLKTEIEQSLARMQAICDALH